MAKKSVGKFTLDTKTGDSPISDWIMNVDSEIVLSAIRAVLAVGCGITFSSSRDGKTVCVTILDDGTKSRAYCPDTDSFTSLCESVDLQGQAAASE